MKSTFEKELEGKEYRTPSYWKKDNPTLTSDNPPSFIDFNIYLKQDVLKANQKAVKQVLKRIDEELKAYDMVGYMNYVKGLELAKQIIKEVMEK